MPNRIIKESICTSDTINQLSWFEEAFFSRLIVNCDDYGRFDGRTLVIKGRLFALKNDVTEQVIANALQKLATVGLVMPYSYDGRPILQLVTWDKHQSVRNKRSKYPAVNGSDTLSAAENVQLIAAGTACIPLHADACNSPRNPIQSNPNPYPEAEGARANAQESATAANTRELLIKQYGQPLADAYVAKADSYGHTGDKGIIKAAEWLAADVTAGKIKLRTKKEPSFDLEEYAQTVGQFVPVYEKGGGAS